MPLEISILIFRMLDDNAILAGAQVCSSWYRVYKSDSDLQRNVKKGAQKRRRQWDKYMAQHKAANIFRSLNQELSGLRKGKIDERLKSSQKKINIIKNVKLPINNKNAKQKQQTKK